MILPVSILARKKFNMKVKLYQIDFTEGKNGYEEFIDEEPYDFVKLSIT